MHPHFRETMEHLLRPGEKDPESADQEPAPNEADLVDIQARLDALAKEQRDEETGYEEGRLTDTAAGE